MTRAPVSLLAAQDRPLRPPLPKLVDRIDCRLDALRAASPADDAVFALVQCCNLAALAEASLGRVEQARGLCLDEIRWLGRVAEHSGRKGLLAYAFQPWINLARLDRIGGDLPSAAERLEALRAAWRGDAAQLADVTLAAGDLPALEQQVPGLPAYLRYNWVHERLLGALRSRSPNDLEATEAVAYAERSVLFNGMALEARLLARRHAADAAAAEPCPYPDVAEVYPANVVLVLRRAELVLADGSAEPQPVNWLALSAIGAQLLAGSPGPWQLGVVQLIVQLLQGLRPDAAAALAALAHGAAERLDDEVLQAWFADACADADAADPAWSARRAALAASSWHASIAQRDRGDEPTRFARLDALRERLLACADALLAAAAAPPSAPAQAGLPGAADLRVVPPVLAAPIQADTDGHTATAALRFEGRRLFRLAPQLDASTPPAVRALIDARDFAAQPSFAGKPYRDAIAQCAPVARYLVMRAAQLLQDVFGARHDESRLRVTVRVDEPASYRQLQGPHVDWSKGTVFNVHPAAGGGGAARGSFAALAQCYSIDSVVGDPQTDYFLDPCAGLCRLLGHDGQWVVDAIDFSALPPPQPAPAACFLLRLPYTVHQFPPRDCWPAGSASRLFVSCDLDLA